MKGLTYWLKGRLYVAVTNQLNANSPVALRGPSFQMPACSGFAPLPVGVEPTAEDIFQAVDEAVAKGKVRVDSMAADPVTFAGDGEPLLMLETLLEASDMIKQSRHGLPLRVRTNGLVSADEAATVAQSLKSNGIKHLSVFLMADNPKQYAEIMQPQVNLSFGDICNFIVCAAEAGLQVDCTAVERPDVNIQRVRSLATSLGATSFSSYKYFPLQSKL